MLHGNSIETVRCAKNLGLKSKVKKGLYSRRKVYNISVIVSLITQCEFLLFSTEKKIPLLKALNDTKLKYLTGTNVAIVSRPVV